MIHCKCGTKFRVKPEAAGKVVTTPCCNTRVRVPANSNAEHQPQADRVRVQCACGQAIALKRPKTAVQITCPTCQKKLRFGPPAAKPVSPPTSDPFDDAFSQDDPFGQPPMGYSAPRKMPKGTKKSKAGSRRKKAKKRAKQRIPRFGIMKEEIGVPALIIVGCVFLAIFSALGIYLATQAASNMAKATASESWQATNGTIRSSGFTVRRGRRGRQSATVNVSYSYTVGSDSYTGTTLSFEKMDSFSPGDAEELLRPYSQGVNCKVFYDPGDPSKSVLIKGVRGSNSINLVLGLLFILGGIVMAVDSWIGALNAHRS